MHSPDFMTWLGLSTGLGKDTIQICRGLRSERADLLPDLRIKRSN